MGRGFVTLLSLLACSSAHGGDFVTIINGPTLHISPERFNRATWGAGFGYQFSPKCASALGTYENSMWRRSYYAALSCHNSFGETRYLYGFTAGIVTGYEAKIEPLTFPEVGYRINDNVRIIAAIIPPTGVCRALTINARLEVLL